MMYVHHQLLLFRKFWLCTQEQLHKTLGNKNEQHLHTIIGNKFSTAQTAFHGLMAARPSKGRETQTLVSSEWEDNTSASWAGEKRSMQSSP
jgi:hypothetical protein